MKPAPYLPPFLVNVDEAHELIARVFYQAIADYLMTNHTKLTTLTTIYDVRQATDFLFDDNYVVDWGGRNCSPEELLQVIGLDLKYLREKLKIEKASGRWNLFRMT